MPRPRKPARVFMREDDKSWVIRDGGKDKRTGHRGKSQVKEAEAALAEYLVERGRGGEVETEQGQLGYLLDAYAEARQGEVADPDRIDYAIEALAPFWSNKSLEEVTEDNCREYTKTRTSNPTARRELGTMRAALNLAFRQRKIPYAPPVWLPECEIATTAGIPDQDRSCQGSLAASQEEADTARRPTFPRPVLHRLPPPDSQQYDMGAAH